MIHTRHKPLEEILQMLSGATKVAVLGCGGCVAFYRTGGAAQVRELAEKLGEHLQVVSLGVSNRQCYLCREEELSGLRDAERIRKIARELEGFDRLEEVEAVLSLACGVGVQNLAGLLELPVYPAQNTLFMGRRRVEGDFDIELCVGCGDCVLGYTGGICPVTRCSKSLMNGPCGGVFNGLCEVSRATGEEIPCAWVEIYRRLKKLGRLEELRRIREPRSHAASGIPRRVKVQEGAG